jgi:hypothetical protein
MNLALGRDQEELVNKTTRSKTCEAVEKTGEQRRFMSSSSAFLLPR